MSKSWFLNPIPHQKEPGLLGKRADYGPGARNLKVSLEHLMPENEEVVTGHWRHIKRTDTGLKESLLVKSERRRIDAFEPWCWKRDSLERSKCWGQEEGHWPRRSRSNPSPVV